MSRINRLGKAAARPVVGAIVAAGAACAAYGQVARPAAPAPVAPAAADYQPNQKVEVREGDTWSPASVVAKEGRKTQVRYADGTLEWVTGDRLRLPRAAPAAGTPAAGIPAATRPVTAPAATRPAAPPVKDRFAVGAKVEVKWATQWQPATVKNVDGDLYLIIRDGWAHQMHWQWVHVSMVRKPGSNKAGPDWAEGVGLGNKTPLAAKAEAQKKYADIEQKLAAEEAKRQGEARERGGGAGEQAHADPFAPKPYDKPISDGNLSAAKQKPIGGPGAAAVTNKPLAPEPANPALAALGAKPIVLKAKPITGESVHLLVGGSSALIVMPAGDLRDATSVRVEPVNLATGASAGVIVWDPLSLPVSVAPSGQRVLGRAPGFFGGTRARVDVWDLPAATPNQPKHVLSFRPYPAWGNTKARDVEWAEMVDNDRLLTCDGKGDLVAWQVSGSTATAVWRATVQGPLQLALSPSRRRLACTTADGLAVLDTATGDTLAFIDTPRSPRHLAYGPDGKHVVGIGGPTVSYWDLEKGTFGVDVGLPAKGAIIATEPVCLGGGHVLLGHAAVLDLARRQLVWRYDQAGSEVVPLGGKAWTVVGSSWGREPMALVPAVLPTEAARRAVAAAGPADAEMLLRPGTSVTLDVAVAGDEQQVKAAVDAVTAQLKRNNVTVADGQPVRVVLRTEDGKTTEQQFRSIGPGGGGTQTVSVTEKITRIYVEANGEVAWEARSVHVPGFVNRKEGQSIGDAVGEANSKYNVGFLANVRVPAYVPRNAKKVGFGASQWTAAGVKDGGKKG